MRGNRLIDLSDLKAAGITVRRLSQSPSLSDEAKALAAVLQRWHLSERTRIRHYDAAYGYLIEPSGTAQPVYVIELAGQRLSWEASRPHPLGYLPFLGFFRLLALVDSDRQVAVALVQPEDGPDVLLFPRLEEALAT
jgi:hypothetical protein